MAPNSASDSDIMGAVQVCRLIRYGVMSRERGHRSYGPTASHHQSAGPGRRVRWGEPATTTPPMTSVRGGLLARGARRAAPGEGRTNEPAPGFHPAVARAEALVSIMTSVTALTALCCFSVCRARDQDNYKLQADPRPYIG